MSRTLTKNCQTDIKIVIVGNSGCGKTSFCSRWTKDVFSNDYKATIMSEFSYKIFQYKDKYYKISFWDIAGQDKSIHTSKVFTKDAHGCLIWTDITNPDTWQASLKWKKAIDDSSLFIDGGNIPCLLVQNKIDLVDEKLIQSTETMLQEFAKENQFINYFSTSAKTGFGVDEGMNFMIGCIVDRLNEYSKTTNNPIKRESNSIVKIQQSKKSSLLKLEGEGRKCCPI